MKLSTALAALLLAAALLACGDDGGVVADEPVATAGGDAGLEHIHGLGVAGGTLYIATHHGMWTAREGETQPRPLGDSRQDIMGFSVVGEDRFIGSGHPDPAEDLPPNLGLIESRDGGMTWDSVSLMGEADFHVLESAGARIYGFDGSSGRLMVSSDRGRTWGQRRPPAGVFSLAIHPGDPDRLVASTEAGIFTSTDGAARWRPLGDQLAGLLAWPAADRLFMVDGAGQVLLSADAGRGWRPVGTIEGQPAAFVADGDELYAALVDGTVKRSADGGRSWTVRATP